MSLGYPKPVLHNAVVYSLALGNVLFFVTEHGASSSRPDDRRH